MSEDSHEADSPSIRLTDEILKARPTWAVTVLPVGEFLSVKMAGLRQRWTWYLKQLLPLTYRTTYGEDGRKHFVVWRMWFGRCFDVEDVLVAERQNCGAALEECPACGHGEEEDPYAGLTAEEATAKFSEASKGRITLSEPPSAPHPGPAGSFRDRFPRHMQHLVNADGTPKS